jgi:pyruvate/2-oxoglutarate dehydrogenase complex dihydrolipoamide acyltransferase (E2) component
MSQLPSSVGADGRIIINEGPAMYLPQAQRGVPGGIVNAASARTIESINQHAAAARALGAGQKGSSRRRRRHRGGAAQNLNAQASSIPTAGSIPGVNPTDNHIKAVNTLNAIRYAGSYDKLINAPPIQLKGGTKKRKSKSKRKNGRRSKRTHRRNRH